MCGLPSFVVVDFESAASARTRFFRYCSDPLTFARNLAMRSVSPIGAYAADVGASDGAIIQPVG